jgi:hypothetical protein
MDSVGASTCSAAHPRTRAASQCRRSGRCRRPGGSLWLLLIETSREPTGRSPTFETGDVYEMTAHSLLLFVVAPAAT